LRLYKNLEFVSSAADWCWSINVVDPLSTSPTDVTFPDLVRLVPPSSLRAAQQGRVVGGGMRAHLTPVRGQASWVMRAVVTILRAAAGWQGGRWV